MWTFLVAVGAWGFRSVFEYGVLDVRSKRRRMSNGFCRLDASLFRADKKTGSSDGPEPEPNPFKSNRSEQAFRPLLSQYSCCRAPPLSFHAGLGFWA